VLTQKRIGFRVSEGELAPGTEESFRVIWSELKRLLYRSLRLVRAIFWK
jgi:hypothetical protein